MSMLMDMVKQAAKNRQNGDPMSPQRAGNIARHRGSAPSGVLAPGGSRGLGKLMKRATTESAGPSRSSVPPSKTEAYLRAIRLCARDRDETFQRVIYGQARRYWSEERAKNPKKGRPTCLMLFATIRRAVRYCNMTRHIVATWQKCVKERKEVKASMTSVMTDVIFLQHCCTEEAEEEDAPGSPRSETYNDESIDQPMDTASILSRHRKTVTFLCEHLQDNTYNEKGQDMAYQMKTQLASVEDTFAVAEAKLMKIRQEADSMDPEEAERLMEEAREECQKIKAEAEKLRVLVFEAGVPADALGGWEPSGSVLKAIKTTEELLIKAKARAAEAVSNGSAVLSETGFSWLQSEGSHPSSPLSRNQSRSGESRGSRTSNRTGTSSKDLLTPRSNATSHQSRRSSRAQQSSFSRQSSRAASVPGFSDQDLATCSPDIIAVAPGRPLLRKSLTSMTAMGGNGESTPEMPRRRSTSEAIGKDERRRLREGNHNSEKSRRRLTVDDVPHATSFVSKNGEVISLPFPRKRFSVRPGTTRSEHAIGDGENSGSPRSQRESRRSFRKSSTLKASNFISQDSRLSLAMSSGSRKSIRTNSSGVLGANGEDADDMSSEHDSDLEDEEEERLNSANTNRTNRSRRSLGGTGSISRRNTGCGPDEPMNKEEEVPLPLPPVETRDTGTQGFIPKPSKKVCPCEQEGGLGDFGLCVFCQRNRRPKAVLSPRSRFGGKFLGKALTLARAALEAHNRPGTREGRGHSSTQTVQAPPAEGFIAPLPTVDEDSSVSEVINTRQPRNLFRILERLEEESDPWGGAIENTTHPHPWGGGSFAKPWSSHLVQQRGSYQGKPRSSHDNFMHGLLPSLTPMTPTRVLS